MATTTTTTTTTMDLSVRDVDQHTAATCADGAAGPSGGLKSGFKTIQRADLRRLR